MEENGTCANVLSQHILFGVRPWRQLYAVEVSCAYKDVQRDIVIPPSSTHCPPSKEAPVSGQSEQPPGHDWLRVGHMAKSRQVA